MANPGGLPIEVRELRHVCIVVRDVEKSIERYTNILGIGQWSVLDFDDSVIGDMMYRGKSVRHRFRAALAMVGSMQLELIQPLEGDSTYSDFLKQHGEGLHHLGIVDVSDLDEAVQTFERESCPCLQSGRLVSGAYAGTRYAYLDMVNALGTIIEVVERPKAPSP